MGDATSASDTNANDTGLTYKVYYGKALTTGITGTGSSAKAFNSAPAAKNAAQGVVFNGWTVRTAATTDSMGNKTAEAAFKVFDPVTVIDEK